MYINYISMATNQTHATTYYLQELPRPDHLESMKVQFIYMSLYITFYNMHLTFSSTNLQSLNFVPGKTLNLHPPPPLCTIL